MYPKFGKDQWWGRINRKEGIIMQEGVLFLVYRGAALTHNQSKAYFIF